MFVAKYGPVNIFSDGNHQINNPLNQYFQYLLETPRYLKKEERDEAYGS